MPVREFLELLGCVEDDKLGDTWLNTMLRRIKIALISTRDPEVLRSIFHKFDLKNQGVISVGDFKSCFLRAGLNFQMDEINRLTRFLEKDRNQKINYEKFLKFIDQVFFDKDKSDTVSKFARQI